jgi:hypothetical protein
VLIWPIAARVGGLSFSEETSGGIAPRQFRTATADFCVLYHIEI